MSERNIELTRRWIEAYNARDMAAFVGSCDPGVELYSLFAAVGGVTLYCGHDGVRRWWREFEESWDRPRIEPEAFFDLAAQTLFFAVLHGRGRQSEVEVAMPYAAVARWNDGLCVYFRSFTDKDSALRDLGVTEDELEPIAP
jgi:ketosteroid isomerase-like protein